MKREHPDRDGQGRQIDTPTCEGMADPPGPIISGGTEGDASQSDSDQSGEN